MNKEIPSLTAFLRLGCLVLAFILAAPCGWAQQVRINSTPNFVGSGARALGMGGAFIAVADDATAASWNPGGLTQLERPELSFVYGWKNFCEKFADTPYINPDGSYDVDFGGINYLSFVYPIPRTIAGRNFVLSLSYQRKYDFDRELSFRTQDIGFIKAAKQIVFIPRHMNVDYKQHGGLASISPAFGFELTERLSLGIAANIWDSSLVPNNEWESTTEQRVFAGSSVGRLVTHEKYDDVKGINYTFGVLYKPLERLSIGAVYHTAYSTDINYTRQLSAPYYLNSYYHSKLRLEWPSALGVGVAYRFADDKLTLSMDVTRRDWDNFIQIDERAGLAGRTSPITGMQKLYSPNDPTYTVRLGAEYVFVNQNKARQNILPSLRAGVMYDPEPASGRKDAWWGTKRGKGAVDNYYGFTLGTGMLLYNRVNIDFDYEYRWGHDVRRDTLANSGIFESGFKEDVSQHIFIMSTVIYF